MSELGDSYLVSLTKVQTQIRECRVKLALTCLLTEREKSRQLQRNVIALESKLDQELTKKLKCPHRIDEVLDDLLGLLMVE